jgi:uncharacterized membrane protein YtjA (UPF0391 family)
MESPIFEGANSVMLRFALLCLTCAVSFGVVGFGAAAPSTWIGAKSLFPIFLGLSAMSFVAGAWGRPLVRLNEARPHGMIQGVGESCLRPEADETIEKQYDR